LFDAETKPPDMSPLSCLENTDSDKVFINLKGELYAVILVNKFQF